MMFVKTQIMLNNRISSKHKLQYKNFTINTLKISKLNKL